MYTARDITTAIITMTSCAGIIGLMIYERITFGIASAPVVWAAIIAMFIIAMNVPTYIRIIKNIRVY